MGNSQKKSAKISDGGANVIAKNVISEAEEVPNNPANIDTQSSFCKKIRGIVSEADLMESITKAREQNLRIAFTNGCFDIIHANHVLYLNHIKEQTTCDILILAVNTDDSIQALKGEERPINPLIQRMETLAGIKDVDFVIPFSELTPLRLIDLIKPDALVKGGDYDISGIVGGDVVRAYGGKVMAIKPDTVFSKTTTTNIIKKIRLEFASRKFREGLLKLANPMVVGICGIGASGKKTVSSCLEKGLKQMCSPIDLDIATVQFDAFLFGKNEKKLNDEKNEGPFETNYDHPTAVDWKGLFQFISQLKSFAPGEVLPEPVIMPLFDYRTETRIFPKTIDDIPDDLPKGSFAGGRVFKTCPHVVILPGYILYVDPNELRDFDNTQMHNVEQLQENILDYRIFIETDFEIVSQRFFERDTKERGRPRSEVEIQWETQVVPGYMRFTEPRKNIADFIFCNDIPIEKNMQVNLLVKEVWENMLLQNA